MTRAPRLLLILTLACFATSAACGGSTNYNTTGPSAPTLALSGTATVAAVGQTSQLTLTATSAQSPAQNVTSQATWTSSNTAIATVSASGLVSAVSYGSATITATYQGVSSTETFSVSIAGTWASPALGKNQQQITWTVSQTGSAVTGTVGFVPSIPAGYAFSVQTVSGTLSGTTLTWTMTLTLSQDTSVPSCVGQTTTLTGTGQILSGTTMTVQATGGSLPCDANLPGGELKASASTPITVTKQ